MGVKNVWGPIIFSIWIRWYSEYNVGTIMIFIYREGVAELLSFFTVVRHFQEYQEPEEGVVSPPRPRGFNAEEEKVVLPLGESTLTNNLGIPIVVVVTKVSKRANIYRYVMFDRKAN